MRGHIMWYIWIGPSSSGVTRRNLINAKKVNNTGAVVLILNKRKIVLICFGIKKFYFLLLSVYMFIVNIAPGETISMQW